MSTTKEDPNILDIDSAPFIKFTDLLDENKMWLSLMEVMPPIYCTTDLLRSINIECVKPNSSPAKVLLLRLGACNVKLSMIVQWLEEIGFEKALMLFKKDEPLQIIDEPLPFLNIAEGSTLSLVCKAESFPAPKYQWFKGEEELLLQQESHLTIDSVNLVDSGLYSCRVHKRSANGNLSWMFSKPSLVIIVASYGQINTFDKESFLPEKICQDSISENQNSTDNDFKSGKDVIEIVKHPVSPGKIAQGSTISLICEAHSAHPPKYQWLCNGRKVAGADSSELKLPDLFPDQNTGEMQWVYQCQIYNDFDNVLTHSAIVELQVADESTQYFAEEKIALLIANDSYDNLEKLESPAKDVATLSVLLSSINFKIFALRNLKYTEMRNAVHAFCRTLKAGVYGLFYYAGHGFDQYGQTYLQPVDCSSNSFPHESLCTEYILQCMQDMEPALSVMLIDTCRRLPSQYNEGKQLQPGQIFKPQMKRNTIYGYATSFLCASHENDSEPNGFFMKHLKKYVTQKIKVQNVLWMVQRDFETDPLAKNLQYPWVASSLCASRCLTDQVSSLTKSMFDNTLSWANVKSSAIENRHYHIPSLDFSVVLEFYHHMAVFCNGIDMYIFLEIGKTASLSKVCQIELTAQFSSKDVEIVTQASSNPQYQLGQRGLQCIVQILQLQNAMESLGGFLLIKHQPTGCVLQKLQLSLGKPKISQLNLSKNHFESRNAVNHVCDAGLKAVNTLKSISQETEKDLISFDDDFSSTKFSKAFDCFSIEENL